MSSAVPQPSHLRPAAHVGQASRNNLVGTDASDQSNPFASLLDAADASPPVPVQPPPVPAGAKPSAVPQGNVQPTRSDASAAEQKSASDASAANSQSPAPPQNKTESPVGVTPTPDTPKKAAKDSTPASDPNVSPDPAFSINALNAAAASTAATANALNNNAASPPKTDKPKGQSGSDQAAAPAADSSTGQGVPAPAAPLSTPANPSPSIASGSGDSGTKPPAGPTAALGDTLQPLGLRGGAGSQQGGKSGAAAGNTAAGIGAGAAQESSASAGASEPQGATDVTQASSQPDVAAATAARERTASAQSDDASAQDSAPATPTADASANPNGTAGADPSNASSGPSSTSKRDASAPSNQIEDVTRQALDSTLRTSPAAGSAHPGALATDGTQLVSGGAAGLVAPAILTTAAAHASTPTPVAVPISGLAVEIAASAQAGNNRFEIRLDPPELGRIEVQLSVDRDGKVASRLVADRPETLALLQRDASDIQRSLEHAGLQTSDNGLQFSLRDQGGFAGQNPYSNGNPSGSARIIVSDAHSPTVDVATAASYGRAISAAGGIDIRV